MNIPTAEQYKTALTTIPISPIQRSMLAEHFRAPNRTITYSQLAKSAGEEYDAYQLANSQYGRLGATLGAAIGFTFANLREDPPVKFYSSAIGMGAPDAYRTRNEFELVMHHELADALRELNWCPA